jgi:hypothetical protein
MAYFFHQRRQDFFQPKVGRKASNLKMDAVKIRLFRKDQARDRFACARVEIRWSGLQAVAGSPARLAFDIKIPVTCC